ncbi:Thioredoxin family protein [Trichomonas vaginalis G3]|uniref:Thioredoxin family protein n=1 Tax=Trichomonas vaginalis (strain ATCC PRA-98 / G3) TaxID=412133 RepID=A2G868_TRIV3|nr:disulfide-isomerase A6 family [Trichomonas vaginalis G3]EAX86650.1 Thioredoxin family protein [Trichomonas vaginalis G3]KAI5483887.1 disulfide-isomerase A6 family [Trichomonas vaginalis G3]|eukprot:XP_001299580.1 Thioredoxin family protein [Trichomonas vaginalis G3]
MRPNNQKNPKVKKVTMLSLLSTFCISRGGKFVTELTSQTWKKLVEKRNNRTVWIVDFQAGYCPACRQAAPYFAEAAEQSHGMVRFGSLDTQKYSDIAAPFGIRYIPTFIIFYPDGYKVYNGERSTRGFCNAAAKYIPNNSNEIDETWAERSDKEAILFTNKGQVPPMWAAISNSFYDNQDGIKIGHALNSEKKDMFNVTAFPTVLVRDGNKSRIFDGKPSFSVLQNFIAKFFDGTLPEATPKPTPKPKGLYIETIDTEEKFEKICHKHKNCVIMAGEPDEEFKKIATKFQHDPFVFASCPAGSKLDYIKKGIWVYHRTQDKCAFVESVDKLNNALDRIIDGSLHWRPIVDVKMDQEL